MDIEQVRERLSNMHLHYGIVDEERNRLKHELRVQEDSKLRLELEEGFNVSRELAPGELLYPDFLSAEKEYKKRLKAGIYDVSLPEGVSSEEEMVLLIQKERGIQKPLFKNQAERDAEVNRRLSNDETYNKLVNVILDLREKLVKAEAEHSLLEFEAKNLRAILLSYNVGGAV